MTINYIQRNQKPQIYLRFVAGKNLDFMTKTNICVEPKFWNTKTQKIRKTAFLPNAQYINDKLQKLKMFVIDKYNYDFTNGQIIDKSWLENAVLLFFDRPPAEKKNDNHTIYFTDFARWWLTHKAGKQTATQTKEQALNTIQIIEQYQNKNKVQLKNITAGWITSFIEHLTQNKEYAPGTVKAFLERFTFFCKRADELNIEINKAYKQRFTTPKQDKSIKHPYLNETEITAIFEHDFNEEHLTNTRDNFIIGLWTGLRVSDFLRLKTDNIKNGVIEIQTQKTKTLVAIPLHYQIKEILERRNGQLPPKTSIQHFNRGIKKICEIVGINTEIKGAIIGKTQDNTKRKKIGVYKKWQLVSSHICRRSFCTNLFGKVPNNVIMSVAGWSSEKQMLDYVKLTHIEKANELKKYWDKKYPQQEYLKSA